MSHIVIWNEDLGHLDQPIVNIIDQVTKPGLYIITDRAFHFREHIFLSEIRPYQLYFKLKETSQKPWS